MQIVEHRGLDAAATLIADMVEGRVDPLKGHVVVI
jgi:hypothetical protein